MIIRRRLLDRMASVIVKNRETLLNGHSRTNNPLAGNSDLAEISRSLSELDTAIAGLANLSDDLPDRDIPDQLVAPSVEPHQSHVFGQYIQLVSASRLEEASRELARMLRMPLDGMITATRFFSRGLKADPGLSERLNQMCSRIVEGSEAECVRMLIQIFGFQAIESRQALEALRTLSHGQGAIADS
ncbi:MAG: hypothetical protein ACE5EQ_09330 [Phycisphaerae bacterium]